MSNDPAAPGPDESVPTRPRQPGDMTDARHEDGKGKPWATLDLIALSIALTLAMGLRPQMLPSVFHIDGFQFWKEGQWGQIVTAVFIHSDLFGLVLNAYWLWLLGRVLERELGTLAYLGFVLAGVVVTGAAELAVSGTLANGMTGISYSIFGYMLAARRFQPAFAAALPPLLTILFFVWVGAALVFHYYGAPGVYNGAHFSGLAFGYGLGTVAVHSSRRLVLTAWLLAASLSFPFFWAPWQSTWLLSQAARTISAGRVQEGKALIARATSPDLYNPRPTLLKAGLLYGVGDHAATKEVLLAAPKAVAEDPSVANMLAWLLATSPDDRVRDGHIALVQSKKACDSTAWKDASYLDTHAAALAETGDFESAVSWLEKALKLELRAEDRAELEKHLAAFKEKRPWRETTK